MSEQLYIEYNPFEGDESDLQCRKVKIIKTRKPQICMRPEGATHEIPAGTVARYETALVDGDFWGRYYTCKECMDRWLESTGMIAKPQPDQPAQEVDK